MADRYVEIEVVSINTKKKKVKIRIKDDQGHDLEQELIVGGAARITLRDDEKN